MKKRTVILIALLILVLAAGLVFGPGLVRGMQVVRMGQELLARESGSAELQLQGDTQLSAQVDWVNSDGRRILRLQYSGVSFYYCDGVVYLENGKGYDFSDAVPDLTPLLENPWLLYPFADIARQENLWTVRLEPGALAQYLSVPEDFALTLTMMEGKSGVEFLGLKTQGMTAMLSMEDREAMTVPREILDAIASGQVQAGQDLTGPMLRLLRGWGELNSRDPMGMTLELSADCGPLVLSDTLEVYRTNVNGLDISYVEKNGLGLYYTDRAVCTADGTVLTDQSANVDMTQLLGLVYQLCLNGELSCQGDVFTLSLDQQGMETVAYAIVPEAREMNVTFAAGTLELTMDGDAIAGIGVNISGSVDVLLAKLDVRIGGQVDMMEGNVTFTVPQAALEALSGEEA